MPLVKKVIYGEQDFDGRELVRRVMRNTGIELSKIKSHNAEDRRIRWTNKDNLNMWLENWEHDLVELGFALRDHDTTGKVHIPKEMLYLIVNLDETNYLYVAQHLIEVDDQRLSSTVQDIPW